MLGFLKFLGAFAGFTVFSAILALVVYGILQVYEHNPFPHPIAAAIFVILAGGLAFFLVRLADPNKDS
jgi:hypothetical protein